MGEVTFGPATADGIPFTASLPKILEPGPLKDRVDGAWQAIKARLLKSVSPGYRAIREAMTPNAHGGCNFRPVGIPRALSLVTVPANPGATITNYKAAATPDTKPMTTLQEQITHWTSERAPLATRMTEIFSPEKTLTEIQQKEYDDLAGRVTAIDGQISRLQAAAEVNKAAAVPLVTSTPAITPKAYSSIRVTPTTPPGTAFIRAACARVVKHGNDYEAGMYAEQRWPDIAGSRRYSSRPRWRPAPRRPRAGPPNWPSRESSTNSSALLRPKTTSARSASRKCRSIPRSPRKPAAARMAGWANRNPSR